MVSKTDSSGGFDQLDVKAPTNRKAYFADMNGDGKLDIVSSGNFDDGTNNINGFSISLQK